MSTIEIPPFLLQQIQEAKAILLLGAGASLSAQDEKGNRPPTGSELGILLADKFLGGNHRTDSLAQIAGYAINECDLPTVQEFIRDVLQKFRPSTAHDAIPRFAWAGLATTNYDRLIEMAYESSNGAIQKPQVFIENGDRIDDKMRDPQSVKLLKLHGCVTRLNNPACPFILTTDQYLTHRNGRSRLFEQLKDWAYERTLIFVGYSLQDADVRHILLELSAQLEVRPRYYLVAPNKDEIEKRFWESKKVTVIGATFEEFLKQVCVQLDGRLPSTPLPKKNAQHEIATRKTFSGATLSKNCLQFLETDVDYVKGVMQTERQDPKQFYKGYNRDWSAIEQGLDVSREIGNVILLDYFLVDEHEQRLGLTWLLVKAHAGAGKSILLRRVAWDAANDYDCLCLYVKSTGRLNAAAIQELADNYKERIYLFIDEIGGRLREVQELAKQLEHSKAKITLVSAERLNEWNIVGSGFAHLVTEEYELPYLSENEIRELLKLLRANKALGNLEGKTDAEQEAAFRDLAGRQILVALHEATMGKPFADIVENEFNNIVPREARQIYLTVCVLHRLGIPVRAGIISRLHNVRFTDFNERFFKPLELVIFTKDDQISQDMVYVSRHPVIADIVFWRVLRDQEERFDLYMKCLLALNIDYTADRKAFRQMIRGKTLQEVFTKPDLVRAVYERVSEIAPTDPYLLHQRGIYEMNRRNFKLANDLLTKARELSPYDTTIKHSLSELLLRSAENARTPLEWEKMIDEATRIAQSIKPNRSQQSYTHHILAKIGIEKLKRLFKNPDAPGAAVEIEREIKAIEQTLTEGLQQFPGDSFLLSTDADLAELLEDYQRVKDSLKQAFEHNPRSGFLAIRLATQFEKTGNNSSSEKVLRTALAANANDKALHFRLAQHLMKRGGADGDTLVYHLQRSFTPGDWNYQAQILYGRQLYLNNDFEASRTLFRNLKEAKAASELKRSLMFPIEGTHGGVITKLDINFASIRKDGSGEYVYAERGNMPASTWRNLTYGTRVKFTIYFNFHGPTASGVQIDGLL